MTNITPPARNAGALHIGFIGAGRLGTALAWSLSRAGCSVAAAASRSPDSAARLAARIADCRTTSAQQVADTCDLVFVTTPDAAIAATASALAWRAGGSVVHCSGATEVAALSKAQDDGAVIGGFHPLQTFADPEAAAASLPGCTITIEAANAQLNATLVDLALRLGCRINQLPSGARAAYHAAAGYASQFVNVLLREASRLWQSWGAGEDAALRALLPLVRGTCASIESSGLAQGMPGPVSRGDLRTVEQHVAALAQRDPKLLALYAALCDRTVDLALERGSIDAAQAAALRALLGAAASR